MQGRAGQGDAVCLPAVEEADDCAEDATRFGLKGLKCCLFLGMPKGWRLVELCKSEDVVDDSCLSYDATYQ